VSFEEMEKPEDTDIKAIKYWIRMQKKDFLEEIDIKNSMNLNNLEINNFRKSMQRSIEYSTIKKFYQAIFKRFILIATNKEQFWEKIIMNAIDSQLHYYEVRFCIYSIKLLKKRGLLDGKQIYENKNTILREYFYHMFENSFNNQIYAIYAYSSIEIWKYLLSIQNKKQIDWLHLDEY
jgi:hypothetical protein